MARRRVELQTLLETILGSRNVYFQPPESLKLKYPCIVYELSGMHNDHADNLKYRFLKQYTVTYIDEDPDSDIPDKLLMIDKCSFSRAFPSDNLNHWSFTLYF